MHAGSLTSRVIARHGPMRVELLSEGLRLPNADEYDALGRPSHRRAWVREVMLHAGGGPKVLAHSILARRDLSGPWSRVRSLGTRPLAVALFADPLVQRAPFEFARLDCRHALWRRAACLLGGRSDCNLGRDARLRRSGPASVTEGFLTGLV